MSAFQFTSLVLTVVISKKTEKAKSHAYAKILRVFTAYQKLSFTLLRLQKLSDLQQLLTKISASEFPSPTLQMKISVFQLCSRCMICPF